MTDPNRTTERLEPRVLLASPAVSAYYPLTPSSHWTYDVTEGDGGTDTLEVRVTDRTRRVNRQEAHVVTYSEGDDTIDTFQNYNDKGKLVIHGGSFDQGELILQPGIKLPGRLKEGYVRRESGDIDFEYDDFNGDGDYTATTRVGRRRQVTVPAGTFSAFRVRVDIEFDAEDDVVFGAGPEAQGKITHVMWLAEGVGVVRAEQRYEVEADFVIDEETESGDSVQVLRSYTVAPAPATAAQQRANAIAASDEDGGEKEKRREAEGVLR
jgi:hypothetical protein